MVVLNNYKINFLMHRLDKLAFCMHLPVALVFIAIIFFLFSHTSSVWAETSVNLDIDRTDAALSDTILLKINVISCDADRPPSVLGLEHFSVENGGTSNRYQMINGKISSEKDYNFYITPLKKGTFTIGPAQISCDGKIYKSSIVVLKIDDSNSLKTAGKNRSLFAVADINKNHGYTGQIFLYNLKFYRLKDVSQVSLDLPDIEGLVFKKLGKHKEYISTIRGKKFSIIELKYAVIADKAGTFLISPALFKMSVIENRMSQRNRFFNDSFFNIQRAVPVSVHSNELDLIVKPLPESGRPKNFSGLVGKFSINSSLSPEKIKTGESATLTTIISGRGNVRLIPDLKFLEIENIKVYADQPSMEIDNISGKKIMKWAIVPQKKGIYTIPSMTLSYFDSEYGRYVTGKTDPLTLDVTLGKTSLSYNQGEQKIDIADTKKKTTKIYSEDIFSIHEGYDALKPGVIHNIGKRAVEVMLFVPAFLFFLFFCIKYLYDKKNIQIKKMVTKKPFSLFLKNIKLIKNHDNVFDILKLVNNYFNESFAQKEAALTSKEIYNRLLDQGIDKFLAQKSLSFMTELENMVYSGETKDIDIKFRQNIIEVIKKIDRKLK